MAWLATFVVLMVAARFLGEDDAAEDASTAA
jgi:hypothetical protein